MDGQWVLGVLLVLVVRSCCGNDRKTLCFQSDDSEKSLYSYALMDIHRERTVNLSIYFNQVLLVVNLAGFCGFTPQYYGLNVLQRDLKNFRVLGFPCNQFGKQEPGANGTEILSTLRYIRPGNGFAPIFDMFEKIDVNGHNEHPLYTYLKAYCPPVQEVFNTEGPGLFYSPYSSNDVRWNFEKFLINKKGKPVLRYHSNIEPQDIRKDIEDLLAEREIDPFSFM